MMILLRKNCLVRLSYYRGGSGWRRTICMLIGNSYDVLGVWKDVAVKCKPDPRRGNMALPRLYCPSPTLYSLRDTPITSCPPFSKLQVDADNICLDLDEVCAITFRSRR